MGYGLWVVKIADLCEERQPMFKLRQQIARLNGAGKRRRTSS